MDAILTAEMVSALSEGNIVKFLGYVAIFTFIWIEVRGLKKEIARLNATISKSFADGEARFDRIEKLELEFEHRLTMLENNQKGA